MSDNITTQCLLFPNIFSKPVAQFDQRQGSSDGGALLLKAAERRYGLLASWADGLRDERQAGKINHTLEELLAQRVYTLACGYEDANDAARLADDPIHKLLLGRDPTTGQALASQPTLSRWENAIDTKELYRMGEALAASVMQPVTGPTDIRTAPDVRRDYGRSNFRANRCTPFVHGTKRTF